MERLAKEFNRFVFEKAPEQRAEMVYCETLKTWILLRFCGKNPIADVTGESTDEELALAFFDAVAFHACELPDFQGKPISKQVEMIQQQISLYSELLSEYIDITDELISNVCADVIKCVYGD